MSGIASFFLLEVDENVNRKYIHFDPIPDKLITGPDDLSLAIHGFLSISFSLTSGQRKSINYQFVDLVIKIFQARSKFVFLKLCMATGQRMMFHRVTILSFLHCWSQRVVNSQKSNKLVKTKNTPFSAFRTGTTLLREMRFNVLFKRDPRYIIKTPVGDHFIVILLSSLNVQLISLESGFFWQHVIAT